MMASGAVANEEIFELIRVIPLLFALSGLFGLLPVRALAEQAEDGPFPTVPEIEGNVQFWVRVFSEWGADNVVVHHIDHPDIVYEVIELTGETDGGYTQQQQQRVKQVRLEWEGYLYVIREKLRKGEDLDDVERQWADHLERYVGENALDTAYAKVRTQRGVRDRFLAGLERSFRYDSAIRATLREVGVPEDLAFLPHVESSFQYHARSSAGATGLWQFTRATGRRYLRITSSVDERLDPLAATRGAARYLEDAYRTLGSWPLAVTSYNHGVQGMQRAREELGDDFGRIVREYRGRVFGFASKNFYAEFLAARRIASDPDHFFPDGFDPEPALDLDSFELERKTTAQQLARHFGVPIGELAQLNPAWLRGAVRDGRALPAGLRVWLPRDVLSRSNGRIPAASAATASSPPPAVHHVRRGDTLSEIASSYGLSLADLRQLNGLHHRSSLIRVGQKLKVVPETHVVRRGETLSDIAARYRTSVPALRSANSMHQGESLIRVGERLRLPAGAATPREHVVRRGDTLLRIAQDYGVGLSEILKLNTLNRRSLIHPGQVVLIPVR